MMWGEKKSRSSNKKKSFFSQTKKTLSISLSFSSRITPETHGWCGPEAVVACLPWGMALSEQAR